MTINDLIFHTNRQIRQLEADLNGVPPLDEAEERNVKETLAELKQELHELEFPKQNGCRKN